MGGGSAQRATGQEEDGLGSSWALSLKGKRKKNRDGESKGAGRSSSGTASKLLR